MNRVDKIVQFVVEHRNYVWDAYDQGRWAAASGHSRDSNPHCSWHVNWNDWFRGFDIEKVQK